jgi:flagellar motility protein MotE (MotC chaperone)
MKTFQNIRLIPVVLVAITSLVILKVAGLALDGGYIFRPTPAVEQRSWAQENLGFPGGENKVDSDTDITGSVDGPPQTTKPEDKPVDPPKPPDGSIPFPEQGKTVSDAERAVLERLQQRRLELDQRAREIDIRESLVKAAEQRVESRMAEVQQVQAQIAKANDAKSDADKERFKGIVSMYENMKPKDAAKIFDQLEMGVLYAVASQMNPRKLSDVLAAMQTENAQRLTVELARPPGDHGTANADLPKIGSNSTP